MTTVLLVPGSMSFGNTGTLTSAAGGVMNMLTQIGASTTSVTQMPVPYNDWDIMGGYLDGATKINEAVKDAKVGDPIVLYGHSFGAVSIVQWLRQYAPTCPVDPSLLRCVLIGNSVRPGPTGAAASGMCAQFNMYGGAGPATTVRYPVIDAARQYDKWADFPNVWSNSSSWMAANACNAGDGYPANIHVSYQHIDFSAPDASVTQGNVTWMLFKTSPPPMSGVTSSQIAGAFNRIVGPVSF